MKRTLLAVTVATLLSGCVSNPISDSDKVSTILPEDQVPEWYLDYPDDEDGNIFASGTGFSDDLQFSMMKAKHSAKTTLGDKLAASVGAEFKSYTADNSSGGQGRTVKENESVSKSGFKDISIRGYEIEKKAAFKDSDGFYRTYVLVKLPMSGPQFDEEGNYVIERPLAVNTFNDGDHQKASAAFERF
jgi:hypothetical protein